MTEALIVHAPARAPGHLFLLFHGMAERPERLRPLGEAIAARAPHAAIVAVRAPDPSDDGRGWHWFTGRGVDDANRPARVAGTMPRFVEAVRHWQARAGLDAARTTLVGFSQGGILSLESTQIDAPPARRVVAMGARFARPPRAMPPGTAVHLLHGEDDAVIPPSFAADATGLLRALGVDATLDLFPGLGHRIDARMVERVAGLLVPDGGERST